MPCENFLNGLVVVRNISLTYSELILYIQHNTQSDAIDIIIYCIAFLFLPEI